MFQNLYLFPRVCKFSVVVHILQFCMMMNLNLVNFPKASSQTNFKYLDHSLYVTDERMLITVTTPLFSMSFVSISW